MKYKIFALIISFFMLGSLLQAQRLTIQAPTNAVTIPSNRVTITERDTLVGLFTFVWDDGYKDVFDSIAAFDTYGIDCSVALTPYQILHGDSATFLTAEKCRYLNNRGWDMGSQGYQTTAGPIWNDDDSFLFSGKYTSLDTFEYCISHAVTAITDTIGLPTPRLWSPPSSGTWTQMLPMLAKYHEFGVAAKNTATGTGVNAQRQNVEYTINVLPVFGLTDDLYPAAYPGLCGNRYELAQGINENASYGDFRQAVINAVKLKAWVIGIMHKPQTLATSTGQSFTTICAFLDSLETAGKLRVVTASEGYDLMYRTPISEAANYIWPNFDDNDSDNMPDFMANVDSLSLYTDSIYGTAAVNYGYGGNGYLTLDWSVQNYVSNPPTTLRAVFGGSSYSWYARFCEWVVPVPAGGRKTARVEFFAQIDTTLHTIAHTESIGVVFYAKNERLYNRWGGTAGIGTLEDATNALWASAKQAGTGGTIGNFGILSAAPGSSEYATGGPWLCIAGTWDVPDHADYLYFYIWKDSALPSGAVKISNISLQWIDRDPLEKLR